MNMVTQVLILDESACISHSANILGKAMNSTTLPPTMNKIVEQIGLFKLGMVTSLEEGKLNSSLLNSA